MAESSDALYGWEISALFVLFMIISCIWQVFIAIITFLNSFYGGAKTIWLTRLKEEVLDVGVISLALVFVQVNFAPCISIAPEGSDDAWVVFVRTLRERGPPGRGLQPCLCLRWPRSSPYLCPRSHGSSGPGVCPRPRLQTLRQSYFPSSCNPQFLCPVCGASSCLKSPQTAPVP
jgi:hypothetical protein